MIRTHISERRRKSDTALTRAAANVAAPEPLIDNVPDPFTAHDVRRLCACNHCKGIGDRKQMISVQKPFHTLCFRQAFGFAAVLALPDEQKDKFRLMDLSTEEMRALLRSRSKQK